MKRSSVRLSVPSIDSNSGGRRFSCCASARAGDIYRQRRTRALRNSCRRALQQRRRSTALSSKCGQCHADSRATRLNTDALRSGIRVSV